MARGLRVLTMAVNPSGARGLSEVDGVISKWEEDVKTFDLQCKETLTDPMKKAIFTKMMPVAYLQNLLQRQSLGRPTGQQPPPRVH